MFLFQCRWVRFIAQIRRRLALIPMAQMAQMAQLGYRVMIDDVAGHEYEHTFMHPIPVSILLQYEEDRSASELLNELGDRYHETVLRQRP